MNTPFPQYPVYCGTGAWNRLCNSWFEGLGKRHNGPCFNTDQDYVGGDTNFFSYGDCLCNADIMKG